MKRMCAPLLALALLLALSGCGKTDISAFRALEVIGARQYGIICRKDDRIAPLIDAGMRSLAASGELSAASLRWLGRNDIMLKGDAAAAPTPSPEAEGSAEEGEAAEDSEDVPPRTLIVGVEADFEPMAFEESGMLRGMSVDIADALGRVLGWEVTYQPITAGEVGTQLSSGNIDCAIGFDPGEVNAEKYTVGVTYMESDVVLAVRSASQVTRLRDLRDQRIGTVDDPVLASLLKVNDKITKYASGATVYLSPQRCINALDNGWCAAVAMDRIMLEHLL